SLAELHDLFTPDERRSIGTNLRDGDREVASQRAGLRSVAASIERRGAAGIKDVGVEFERPRGRRRDRDAAVAGCRGVGRLACRRALHQHHGHEVADLVRALPEIERGIACRGAEERAVGLRGRGRGRRRERRGEAGGLLGAASGKGERQCSAKRDLADHRGRHRGWWAVRSISSTDEIIFELISWARWHSIMLTSSSTMFTLEASSMPWRICPRPVSPPGPICAAPLAAVSVRKLSPIARSPAGLVKLATWIW